VSHRPKPEGWHPEAPYHFVDDVAAAIANAKELAGDCTVAVAAGNVVDSQHLLEDPDVVIQGDRVLHLRYRVRR
jgi:hypothetical protein